MSTRKDEAALLISDLRLVALGWFPPRKHMREMAKLALAIIEQKAQP